MSPSVIALLPIPIIISLILFLSQRTHLLIVLLATESILLTFAGFVVLTHGLSHLNAPFILFLFLALGACEAALGLAILVAISRSFGSDLLSALSINNC